MTLFPDTSSELFQRAKIVTPGGVHSPVRSFKGLHTTPRFIKNGKGAYITDEENKTYIDFLMSFGPLMFGHQDPDVKNVIQETLNEGWSFGATEKHSLFLAEYMVEHLPFIEQVRFVNSGTEAVMAALRLARGFTGRKKILKFNGCYHGHLDSMLLRAGSGVADLPEASSLGISPEAIEHTIICDLDNEQAVEEIFKKYGNEIAAIAIEPIPANNGLLPQRLEYLKFLREISSKYGSLLLFDEVISGFRVAFGGMTELTGIKPDLVTYGKIIGAGLPVGALAGNRNIMEYLAPCGGVYQAGTLSANPMAMRAGLVTLKKLKQNNFYQTLEKTSQTIVHLLQDWSKKTSLPEIQKLNWTRFGSLFWPVSQDKNSQTSEMRSLVKIPESLNADFKILFELLLNKGVYIAPNAFEVGFISSAHGDEKVLADLKKKLLN